MGTETRCAGNTIFELQQTDVDKTHLENVLQRHKLKLPKA